ncbi:MAG: TasA family protein [Peptococcia bacterium]
MRKRVLISLLLMGILVLGIGIGTYAWFTSEASSKGNVFTAGILEVGLSGDGETELDFGCTENMQPGDETEEVQMVISNEGNLDLAWFGYFKIEPVDAEKSSRLLRAIYIKNAQMEFLNPEEGVWEPIDQYITDGKGSGPYPGTYNDMAAADPFGVISLNSWMNGEYANVMGMGKGVQTGALRPGYKYRLTLQFGFAPEAGNAYQGDQASALNIKYVVKATQVKEGALAAIDANDKVISIGSIPSQMEWLNAQLVKQADESVEEPV